jgi:DNA-directed RNA polymerase specialized sigma24 family protein
MSILQRVSPNQYMYARLYFNYDMNYKEISEDIEVPEGTAKSQISRAKASLREIINDFDKKERVKSVA